MRAYTMQSVRSTADQAVGLARELMTFLERRGRIHDVQDDPRFQHRGVDLLWDVPGDGGADRVLGVEVKGDRHGRRGNYFFELISNVEKDTPGCFLYSAADVVLYAFVREREVHQLPLAPLREWFLPQAKRFPTAQARTKAGTAHYTTVGALVPVLDVQRAVTGAARWRRRDEGAWDRKAVRG